MRKGILFVVSGPSGAGKGTILKEVLEKLDNLTFSVSATTREKRAGEIDGVNYFFMSKEEFAEKLARGEFLEHVEKFGNCYGTLKSFVEEKLAEGVDLIFDIETEGAGNIREMMPDAVTMFVTPTSKYEILKRLEIRGSESPEEREKRFAKADAELSEAEKYDYIIVNDRLEDAVNTVVSVISAERARTKNNKYVIDNLTSQKKEVR